MRKHRLFQSRPAARRARVRVISQRLQALVRRFVGHRWPDLRPLDQRVRESGEW